MTNDDCRNDECRNDERNPNDESGRISPNLRFCHSDFLRPSSLEIRHSRHETTIAKASNWGKNKSSFQKMSPKKNSRRNLSCAHHSIIDPGEVRGNNAYSNPFEQPGPHGSGRRNRKSSYEGQVPIVQGLYSH